MQNRGDDPFVAQIQVNGQHWCGEFIYNSEWIVTTAACVMGRYKSYTFTLNKFRFCFLNFWANHRYRHQSTALLVVVGQIDLDATDPSEQSISISAVHIHNDYDQYTRYNDIAMLQVCTQTSAKF